MILSSVAVARAAYNVEACGYLLRPSATIVIASSKRPLEMNSIAMNVYQRWTNMGRSWRGSRSRPAMRI
jgi:hypothetical protein